MKCNQKGAGKNLNFKVRKYRKMINSKNRNNIIMEMLSLFTINESFNSNIFVKFISLNNKIHTEIFV